jgi:hypothetical protein
LAERVGFGFGSHQEKFAREIRPAAALQERATVTALKLFGMRLFYFKKSFQYYIFHQFLVDLGDVVDFDSGIKPQPVY